MAACRRTGVGGGGDLICGYQRLGVSAGQMEEGRKQEGKMGTRKEEAGWETEGREKKGTEKGGGKEGRNRRNVINKKIRTRNHNVRTEEKNSIIMETGKERK